MSTIPSILKKLTITCLLLPLYTQLISQDNQSWYVSTFGDDGNPGTIEKPFKTIHKARDAVREAKKETGEDLKVILRGGTHFIEQPLVLDREDSGKKGQVVSYMAHNDEQPVISGGTRIKDWEPYENGIWRAPVQGLNFRQLYVNNNRAIRARHPNKGDYFQINGWDLKNRKIIIPSYQIDTWNNLDKVEMVLQQTWAESYLRLNSFTVHGSMGGKNAHVSIHPEEEAILFPRPYPKKTNDQYYHFENAMEFLDLPGEWYLDLTEEMVYYMPRTDENMAYINVVAPKLETLIFIGGSLDNPARNIEFKGITFAHSSWLYPGKHGYVNMQAGQFNVKADSINNQYVDRPPAAISVTAAENIRFHRNIIQHAGATGIDLHYGTSNCIITGNIIHDISGNGISVGKFTRDKYTESHLPYNPEDKREICRNDEIRNNIIYRTGRDYYGCCSIAAGYPEGLKIEHNVIRDNPYSGISVGFGWTPEPNAMQNNVIANNMISDVMHLLADGAAIYTLSLQPGTKITGNYITDMKKSEWSGSSPIVGIYLDEATGGTKENPFLVKENFIEEPRGRRFNFHSIGQVVIDNNFMYKGQNGEKKTRENAGLEPEFSDLKNIIAKAEKSAAKTKDVVMLAELKDETEAIRKYDYYHSAEGVWPEIAHAALSGGFLKIRIYRYSNKLVMVLTYPEDADLDEINRKYAASSNRITTWGELMSSFMQSISGGNDTWVPMKLIHDYENGQVIQTPDRFEN